MKKILHLTLDTALDEQQEREPLAELLSKAVRTITAGRQFADAERESRWLIRQAIRAVCEEVIATREIVAPLKVRFVHKKETMRITSEMTPPPRFRHYRN